MVQHLEHGAAGFDDAVRRQSLAEQIVPRDVAVGHVDVRDVIDDLAVGLFRNALVEAAVPGLHVENRDVTFLGGDRTQAGVGVAQHQERVGAHLFQHRVDLDQDLPGRLRRVRACGVQKEIGLAQSEILEEDLVQFVVIILPRVDQNMFDGRRGIELLHDARQADDLGPCPDNGEDLEFFHGFNAEAQRRGGG